jgi:ribokinase
MGLHSPLIAVLGDVNIDAWFLLDERPRWNEVIHSHRSMLAAGGKGLNMALGVARLGGKASLLSLMGDDIWAETLLQQIRDLLVRLDVSSDSPAGEVMLDNLRIRSGSTPICGVLANHAVDNPAFIGTKRLMQWDGLTLPSEWRSVIARAEVLVACLAPPMEIVYDAVCAAREGSTLVILNPGPPPRDVIEYQRLADILDYVDVLVPNTYEARRLISMKEGKSVDVSSAQLAEQLQGAIDTERIGLVCVTKGREGFYAIYCSTEEDAVEANRPKRRLKGTMYPITTDPVGTGAAFCSALAVELAKGKTVEYALRFAATAASVVMRTPGAAAAMPSRQRVETLLRKQGSTVVDVVSDKE